MYIQNKVIKVGKKAAIFWYRYIRCCVWIDDEYYLLGDAHRLYRKIEIGPVANTPANNPINAAPTINPEFDEHSVEYIKQIHVPIAKWF